MFQLICRPGCKTCAKAAAFLDERGIEYTTRTLPEEGPDAQELKDWHKRSGAPLRNFWNTSEVSFRSFRVYNSSRMLNNDQQYLVMTGDKGFIAHPILVGDDLVLAGFVKEQWEAKLPKNVD
jgi:arsenate reductase